MTRERWPRPDTINRKLRWLLQGLSVCMLVAVAIMGSVGIDRHPTSARIDMGLPVLATFLMTIATFIAQEKSQMIKRTCICVALAAFTLLAFVLHELFPALGSSS